MRAIFLKLKKLYNLLTHEDELFVYASSLSFYTIFAFLPLLFIVISILFLMPNFKENFFEQVQSFILSNVIPTQTETILKFLDPLLQDSSKMGIVGFTYIVATSILFFRNYEYITSKMFDSNPREFFNSLSLYWTLISLLPLILGVSFYFGIRYAVLWSGSGFFYSIFVKILPILMGWMIFLILFKLSANRSIRLRALFLSSLLTSIGWNLAKWVFVYYVAYNRSYENLYGSVSAILFAMLWIYVSWFIVLLGMRICFLYSRHVQKEKDLLGLKQIKFEELSEG